ncbi:polyamine aminopropyltransferase [Chitinimonas sp. BJB300]|uniref:polyamine aminopropyltransferase n=1 Tax=Chitinimonas sp. BJB300 TaxID=1559339 RepID=UPI000C10340A|nr:polyamine aminopropyltransferase [Chitinimonas sp. BJB300]PHV12650.1 spermidine synthase [Chitinimonas sp. BJB300]TSJ91184.1 polyamine aminopropyltransferase [Chitinimonas sp. BJB300]
MPHILLFSVFVVAACGLAYELVAAALSSYLIGDSVTQFSTVIGVYLFAMGVGSWLSRHVHNNLAATFIRVELGVGLIGGFSAAMLFWAFAWISGPFLLVLYLLVFVIGTMVGLEIPLVMRLLEPKLQFKELVSQVLSVDYLGALAVSLLFPLWLAPKLGMVRTALLFGLLNAAVALWTLWLFRTELNQRKLLWAQGGIVLLLLAGGFAGAERLSSVAENALYEDHIVLTESTPYQRIVLTRWKDDWRLFLNNNLQFSSRDEYRYHEALVHPGLAAMPWARRVLVLGGGDGMAVREILKYPYVQQVTLVELDPAMPLLFQTHPALRKLNGDALNASRLRIVTTDAFKWLQETEERFDFVVVDFPDPSNYAVGKLYTNSFYRLLERSLNVRGRAVIQTTSPLYARQSYWTVVNTVESVGLHTQPYHTLVPSFGEWGYVLVGREPYTPPTTLPTGLRFLTPTTVSHLFDFPADMARVPTDINRLNNQVLVRTFEQEWKRVQR